MENMLQLCKDKFPTVTTLNMGGGFKVARAALEIPTNILELGTKVQKIFVEKAPKHMKL